MKKFLSIVLALTMIFSTVAFAAPAMVGTVETAAEVTAEAVEETAEVEEMANVAAEGDYGILVYDIDFSKFGTKVDGTTYLADYVNHDKPEGLPEAFPYEKVTIQAEGSSLSVAEDSESGNKYMQVVSQGNYPSFRFMEYDDGRTLPGGKYTLVFDIWADENNSNTLNETKTTENSDGTKTVVDATLKKYSMYATQNFYDATNNKTVVLRSTSTETYELTDFEKPYSETVSVYGFKGETYNGVTTDTFQKIQVVLGSVGDRNTTVYDAEGNVQSTNTTETSKRLYTKNTFYVDNIKFYFKPAVDAKVDFYDFRKGYMDITLPYKHSEITTENAHDAFVSTADAFDAAAKIIENSDGTATYRLYENTSLRGRTVTLKSYCELSDCYINFNACGTKHTYGDLDMTRYDGENLLSNGDFSNPYYNIFSTSSTNCVIDEDGVLITLKDNAIKWNSVGSEDLKYENAKYYVEFDMEHAGMQNDTTVTDASYSVPLYLPNADNTNTVSITNEAYCKIPSHIPDAVGSNSAHLSVTGVSSTTKASVKIRKILDLTNYSTNDKYGNAIIGSYRSSQFQICPGAAYQVSGSDKCPSAEGLSVRLKKFSIKKMFQAFFTDGEVTEALDIAKDVEFTLPTALGNKPVAYWIDENGNKIFADTYTPDEYVEDGITFTAVYATTPYNEQKSSIRFDVPGGIRFLASVTTEQKENLNEYGFIASRKVLIENAGKTNEDLAFGADFTTVSGVSYGYDAETGKNVDKIYEIEGENIFFTAVITGIPEAYYNDQLVVRPYSKVGDVYYYGEVSQKSVLDVAKSIRDGGYANLTDEQKEKCYEILFENGEYLYKTDDGYVLFDDNAESGNPYGLTAGYGATLSSVEDPYNESNTVYSLDVKSGITQNWTYIWSPAVLSLEENGVYRITYDVLLKDKDANNLTVEETATNGAFNFNGVAGDKGFKGSSQHALASGWSTITCTSKLVYNEVWSMALTSQADTNSGLDVPAAKFGVYADPKNQFQTTNSEDEIVTQKYACSYYIDNIKVIKLAD